MTNNNKRGKKGEKRIPKHKTTKEEEKKEGHTKRFIQNEHVGVTQESSGDSCSPRLAI